MVGLYPTFNSEPRGSPPEAFPLAVPSVLAMAIIKQAYHCSSDMTKKRRIYFLLFSMLLSFFFPGGEWLREDPLSYPQ